jgi:hypothetical protein
MTQIAPHTRPSTAGRFAETVIRAFVAFLLALAAPAVSLLPALATGFSNPGNKHDVIAFPHGFAVLLIVTLAVTAAACALAGYLGRRAALFAIPLALFWWAISGLGVIVAGIALGHSHTIEWGVVLLAAAVVGALVGMPIAARSGPVAR